MPQINVLPDSKIVEAEPSQTLLEAILAADIPHTHACGGQAHCSTCRVMVLDGIENCTSPTEAEKILAKKLQFPVHVRLACQTRSSGNVSVRRMVIDNEDIDLGKSQLAAGAVGVEEPIVLMRATIRGATNFDEVNFPYDILYVMGRCFKRSRSIVSSYGGNIDCYMNNRFMASFQPHTAEGVARAVWAGLELIDAIDKLNEFLAQLSYNPLNISLGIHYGAAILVPIDPERSSALLPLGDAVNIVSRVETANAKLDTKLLISEPAFDCIRDRATARRRGSFSLSSDDRKMAVYEVSAMTGEPPENIPPQAEETGLSDRLLSFVRKLGRGKSQ